MTPVSVGSSPTRPVSVTNYQPTNPTGAVFARAQGRWRAGPEKVVQEIRDETIILIS